MPLVIPARLDTFDFYMTTTVSLAARDFVVVGCDSLATMSLDLVYPNQITSSFFEADGRLKADADGKPLLNDVGQIWELAQSLPVNQLPSVTKLYDLAPFKAALLFAGAARIGETTIRNLVETFKACEEFSKVQDQEVEQLAEALRLFVLEVYSRELPDEHDRPLMEILLSGYSVGHREPEVWRMLFYFDKATGSFVGEGREEIKRKQYDVTFGGQYDVIQRVVNGIDVASYQGINVRVQEVLEEYHQQIEADLRHSGYSGPVPKPDLKDSRFDPFSKNFGNVSRIFSDIGSLSEQAGINFVYFLINVMINAQEFSNSIPTVGGPVHLAILTKNDGFRWISKEGFSFEGQHVPKFPHHA